MTQTSCENQISEVVATRTVFERPLDVHLFDSGRADHGQRILLALVLDKSKVGRVQI